jgi:hypothetical protein
MAFAWTRKIRALTVKEQTPEEAQVVTLPVNDKISVIEHKNVEVAGSRKEDDEVGGRKEEGDGQEVVLPRAEDRQEDLQEARGRGGDAGDDGW